MGLGGSEMGGVECAVHSILYMSKQYRVLSNCWIVAKNVA